MKKRKILRKLLLAVLLWFAVLGTVKDVSAATVNISGKYLTYSSKNTVKRMKYLKKKIGGMKMKRNKEYPDFYAVGNKMVLGVNRKYHSLIIQNRGNRRVRIIGIRIGMTGSNVSVKMEKAGFGYDSWTGNGYWFRGEDAWFDRLTFRKGRLKSWKYAYSMDMD